MFSHKKQKGVKQILALRKKKSESTCDALAVPQTAGKSHPFLSLSSYSPSHGDMELYKSLREAIPVIDAAIYKLIRLLGSFRVNCTDERAEEELKNFLGSVNVGGTRRGIDAFVGSFFEQLNLFTIVFNQIRTGTKISEFMKNQG
jgi:hypothetical protein